jgi:hypothetical protein
MQYRLRTLLILLAVGPVALAASYWAVKDWQARRAEAEAKAALQLIDEPPLMSLPTETEYEAMIRKRDAVSAMP